MSYFRLGFVLVLLATAGASALRHFLQQQVPPATRVLRAKARYGDTLRTSLRAAGCNPERFWLYLRAFKTERVLEAWVAPSQAGPYHLLRQYDFCASSGTLGPKRQSGDRQIPEGLYRIDRFNPRSAYHLSLGISYPDASDRQRAAAAGVPPGGDIFIHGNCVTIGCIPITDARIEELYVLALWARGEGQATRTIPVHLFPARMHDANWAQLQRTYADRPDWLTLWRSLRATYLRFEAQHRL